MFTLSICKPAIRRKARENDWVMGISPKGHGHTLCYAAHITEKFGGEKYYSKAFEHRADCIYRFDGDRFWLRPERVVHSMSDMKTDVGRYPTYLNAVILRSARGSFWYYGKNAKNLPRSRYPQLRRRLNRLNQGHRVNHSKKVHEELKEIIRDLERHKPGVHGRPRDPPKQISHDAKCSKQHGVC